MHVVDSKIFLLIVPNYTEPARRGAYSSNAIYTPQYVAHIASILRRRGAVRCAKYSHLYRAILQLRPDILVDMVNSSVWRNLC